jgi:hypothetical protein
MVRMEGKEKAIKIELPETLAVQGPGSERYDRHGPDG